MKQKAALLLADLLLAVLLPAGCSAFGEKPLEGLRASDLQSVSVQLLPPDVELELTEEETGELVELLRRAVVYGEDDSYTEYEGQAIIFTLTRKDGSQMTVNAAYNLFLILDGTGYRAESAPLEALSGFANALRTK